MNHVVSQATPFAKRGRVWSRCNYQVAEERNYRPLQLGNKMLTSAKHDVLYSMTTDAICEEHGSDWSHQVSAVATTQRLQCDHTLPLSVKGCGHLSHQVSQGLKTLRVETH